MASSGCGSLTLSTEEGRVEDDAVLFESPDKSRNRISPYECTSDCAGAIDAVMVELENVMQRDGAIGDAGDLRDMRNSSTAIAETCQVDD